MTTVLLTGLPGVGKTTLIKKLSDDLTKKSINFIGFYTEEVRNDQHQRIGFDIRTFDGRHNVLARNDLDMLPNVKTNYRIGQYHVYINNFDEILLPFTNSEPQLVVIDEIGSMELMSKLFQNYMDNLVKHLKLGNAALIATIALNNKRNNPLINTLKTMEGSSLITVTKNNRNQIYPKILEDSLKILKK